MSTNNRQLAHLWAAQSKPRGKGHNFYFEGPTIYSYGAHFPIASFVAMPNGGRCVLFTTDRYGQATSKHINYARSALFGLGVNVFTVPHVPVATMRDGSAAVHHPDNVRAYLARIDAKKLEAARARKHREMLLGELARLQQEAELYRATFAPDMAAITMTVTDDELREALAVKRAAEKAQAERDAAKNAEARAEWRAGEGFTAPGDTMLRLSRNGENIETSRGANVPVSVAPRLWVMVQRVRLGEVFELPPGASAVGSFQLRDITACGDLIVGCHHIRFAELDAMAGVLGLKDAPPEIANAQA